MYLTAVMEIMFTSPMGTEKRSRESNVGLVSCNPPKKGAQDAGGTEYVRLVVGYPRPFFCKRTSFFLAIGGNSFGFSYAMQ